jgi:polysaccharide export outer membrane protein/exopolysaccharide production protein ExoF
MRLLPSFVFLLCCTHSTLGLGQEGEYRLGPEDRVRISVHEWRAARNEVHEWTALKGEFVVNTAGKLSLPLIGEVAAETLRTSELATLISDRLQAKVGFAQRPDTAVEIIQHRPFYILGVVNKPGDYPYRPGISVLQAVSLAGGFYRPSDAGLPRFRRETITSQGELRVFAADHVALLARRSRLEAELAGRDAIAFPPELTTAPSSIAVQAMREETTILQARRESLSSQLDALARVKSSVQKEIEALRAKDATQERQLRLAKRDLEGVNALVAKGLAVAPRQLSLEQAVAQIESSRQDVNLSIIRAEQDINKAERDMLELRNQRRNEVLAELRLSQSKLQEIRERAATARELAYESETTAPSLYEEQVRSEMMQPVFSILRKGAQGYEEKDVSQADPVLPGDIIKVDRPRVGFGREASQTGAPPDRAAPTTPQALPAPAFASPSLQAPPIRR